MLADLDDESSLDPALSGSKGSQLAVARKSGLPVLPGLVVTGPASRAHMRLGAGALTTRGSGGARLVVSGHPIDDAEAIVAAGEQLAHELVARSSTLLESSGAWAGAFTSYVDLAPGELPKAVAGCWASAFSVDALERQKAAGVVPGSFDMAVLIQPALQPRWGGAAELLPDGTIVVHGVEGSPAPLLQGWVQGETATRQTGTFWEGGLARQLDASLLESIADMLRQAKTLLGANRCEWAIDERRLWLLQLDTVPERQPEPIPRVAGNTEDWLPIVRTLVSAPGRLGAELVLPWAIGKGVPVAKPRENVGPGEVQAALRLSRELTSRVWGLPADQAVEKARACLEGLFGPRQVQSLRLIGELRDPDPEISAELMSLVHGIRSTLAAQGAVNSPETAWNLSTQRLEPALEDGAVRARMGASHWEPLIAAVVLTHGRRQEGTAASPGLGSGLLHPIEAGCRIQAPAPRSVLHSEQAAPVLSQLLWDASGLVTGVGSPAAHVFESARSLGVPAVTGVDLAHDQGLVVAVDGFAGVVASITVE